MKLFVDCTQILPIHMSVNLRRGNIDMTEHFLHRPQVSATFQQMGRKGMTEGMRRHGFRYPNLIDVLPQNLPRPHPRHRLAAGIEKEHTLPFTSLQFGS